jgi:hypothetical protein
MESLIAARRARMLRQVPPGHSPRYSTYSMYRCRRRASARHAWPLVEDRMERRVAAGQPRREPGKKGRSPGTRQ